MALTMETAIVMCPLSPWKTHPKSVNLGWKCVCWWNTSVKYWMEHSNAILDSLKARVLYMGGSAIVMPASGKSLLLTATLVLIRLQRHQLWYSHTPWVVISKSFSSSSDNSYCPIRLLLGKWIQAGYLFQPPAPYPSASSSRYKELHKIGNQFGCFSG